MGGRVTRTPQSRELVRAKSLRQALESGAPPAFIPPVGANSAGTASSLSWATEPLRSTSKKSASAEKLEIRHQYLEQLFQSCPEPLIIVDASFRTLCVNQEFQRMFGYSAAQIMGQSIDGLILPAERKSRIRLVHPMPAARRTSHLETQRRCKDGTLLDVSLSCAPLHHRWPHRRFLRHLFATSQSASAPRA